MGLVAIISDIHANRLALQAVLADMESFAPEVVYNLGDTVGYGPEPNACLQWARQHASVSLLGNHDAAAVGMLDLRWFNPWAREAVEWTARQLNQEERLWLRTRPHLHRVDTAGGLRLLLAHGTPRHPVTEYIDPEAAADILARPQFDVCLVGHTHLMGVFTRRGYRPLHASADLTLEPPCIVNVGSVGQPRDGFPQAGYVLLDPTTGRMWARRVPYDVSSVQQAILQANLPVILAERLAHGR